VTANPASPRQDKDEIEIKLPCESLETVRGRLREGNATAVSPQHFESNDLFDNAAGQIAASGSTLRLRRADGRALLTFKGPARFEGGVKRREERETVVAEAAEMEAILGRLGFSRRFRYEKRREEWKFEDCVIALDQTPIGDFVEIEGDPSSIRQAVARLELDSSEAIPYSYSKLYSLRREKDLSLPRDMVFSDPAGRE
jgi:adenylate cyclase class 2